jgi:hypothetical protein
MSHTDKTKVAELNDKVYERGMIDREHLLEFLTLIDTNDQQTIVAEVKNWITKLHEDPKYDKIRFPGKDIDAIIGDLDSYGRVQPETIYQFKQQSNKSLPLS